MSDTLEWHAENWDLTRSWLRRRTAGVSPGGMPRVWEAYIRLVAVDLALRVAAYLQLAAKRPDALDLLDWASSEFRGEYLNRKRRDAGLTLDELAEAVGVTPNTVDAWMYHGVRLSDSNLENLAGALAGRLEDADREYTALELRALYWVSDVASLLSEHIGWQSVSDVLQHLRRYATDSYHLIDGGFPAEGRLEALAALAEWGAGARVAVPLLRVLADMEPDEEWRKDLVPMSMGWFRRVLSVNTDVSLEETEILNRETGGGLLESWDVRNPEAYAHYRRSFELQAEGRQRESLAEVEIAARLDPQDPANHFTIGSVKTAMGIGLGDREMVREGLDSLWLAASLDPSWIVPWTEIGSTLYYTDMVDDAAEHLRGVKPECGPLDARYYSLLGTVEWRLGNLPEALVSFESGVELDPEDPSTLLPASELARLTGDGNKSRRYLRRARHFGADEGTLRFWDMMREFGEEMDSRGGGVGRP